MRPGGAGVNAAAGAAVEDVDVAVGGGEEARRGDAVEGEDEEGDEVVGGEGAADGAEGGDGEVGVAGWGVLVGEWDYEGGGRTCRRGR